MLCIVCTPTSQLVARIQKYWSMENVAFIRPRTRLHVYIYVLSRPAGVMQHGRLKRRTAYTCISVSSRSVVHQIQAGRAGIGAGQLAEKRQLHLLLIRSGIVSDRPVRPFGTDIVYICMRQWSPAYGTEHSHQQLDRRYDKQGLVLTSSITNLARPYGGSSDRYGSTHGRI